MRKSRGPEGKGEGNNPCHTVKGPTGLVGEGGEVLKRGTERLGAETKGVPPRPTKWVSHGNWGPGGIRRNMGFWADSKMGGGTDWGLADRWQGGCLGT